MFSLAVTKAAVLEFPDTWLCSQLVIEQHLEIDMEIENSLLISAPESLVSYGSFIIFPF